MQVADGGATRMVADVGIAIGNGGRGHRSGRTSNKDSNGNCGDDNIVADVHFRFSLCFGLAFRLAMTAIKTNVAERLLN
jgi:hypothetical protein